MALLRVMLRFNVQYYNVNRLGIRSLSKIHEKHSFFSCILGGISAALTTPLDVAKTRIMLAEATSMESKGKILPVWKLIYQQNGFKG